MGQTTNMSTVSLNQLVDLVEKNYVTHQQMIVPQAARAYIEDFIPDHNGESKRYDEVDTEQFAGLKREGMDADKASVGIGNSITITTRRLAKEIDITWEMRHFNKSERVRQLFTSLNNYVPQRVELDLSHRLITYASSTSYTNRDGQTVALTGTDGLAIASTAHTLPFSSTTWSNRVANDPLFSTASLTSAEKLFVTDSLSLFGEKRVIKPNAIIVTDDTALNDRVDQVLQSTADVDQNNPGVVNVKRNKYDKLVLPYAATDALGSDDTTKREYWALAAIGIGEEGLQAYHTIWEKPNLKSPPTDTNNAADNSNDNWTWGTRGSDNSGIVSGRGIVYSLPTTS